MAGDELSYEECDRIAAEVRAAQKAATGSADIRNRRMLHALINAGAKFQREREPQFPEGKLNDDDEGALAVKVGTESGRVVFRFPKPVAWFAVPAEQALDMAELLIQRAVALGVKRPVTLALGARVALTKPDKAN